MAEPKSIAQELETRMGKLRVPISYMHEIPDIMLPKVATINVYNAYHEYLETNTKQQDLDYILPKQEILSENFLNRAIFLVESAISYSTSQFSPNKEIYQFGWHDAEIIREYVTKYLSIDNLLAIPEVEIDDYLVQVVFGIAGKIYNSRIPNIISNEHNEKIYANNRNYRTYPSPISEIASVKFTIDNYSEFMEMLIDNLKTAVDRIISELGGIYLPSGSSRNFSLEDNINAVKEIYLEELGKPVIIEEGVTQDAVDEFVKALEEIASNMKKNPKNFEVSKF